jgi:biotin carboxylase
MTAEPFTLMLTSVGGSMQPQVIRFLKDSRRHDIRVVGVDQRPDAVGRRFCDVFAVVPGGDDPAYAGCLANLAEAHGVQLILPASDEEALALSANRAVFDGLGCELACVPYDTLALFVDKPRAYRRFAELGLYVPDWQLVDDIRTLPDALSDMLKRHGEVAVKPAAARGGREVCVVRREAPTTKPPVRGKEIHVDEVTFRHEHMAGYSRHLPVLLQQRVLEPYHDIDLLAWQGKPIHVVPRHRVDMNLPDVGHRIADDPKLVELGQRIVTSFNLSWLYDCDVMFDANGRPGLLEVNPRPSGSVAATVAAGVPLFDDLISLAKGEHVAPGELPAGRFVAPYRGLAGSVA